MKTKLFTLSGRPVGYRLLRYSKTSFNKGETMFNRNLGIACVGLGLCSSLFVVFASKGINAETAATFTILGNLATAAGALVFMLTGRTKAEEEAERAELHRAIDAVYRPIDDTRRDLSEEIRECERTCAMRGTCYHSPNEVRGKR